MPRLLEIKGCKMPSGKTHGTLTVFSAFMSFLSGLSTFNALLLLTLQGSNFTVEFSLFDVQLGVVNVFIYLLISLMITSVFLGSTFFSLFRGLPADPEVLERLAKVEASSTLNTNMLENMQVGFFRRLEENETATEVSLQKMNMGLEETRTVTNNALEVQQQILKNAQEENKKNAQVLKKQTTELTGVRKRVEKVEKALTPAKTKVTSKSKLNAVKGVKPNLAEGMRNMGIRNVGQFLTTDAAVIAAKTSELHETVTNLQAQAQLLMVPGVDVSDAELLVKVGVTSRKDLADQDPVQLSRAIVNVTSTYVEKGRMAASRVPTVDDVWSWIRSARH